MEKITKEVWKTVDGEIFEKESDATEHENKLAKEAALTSYWYLRHNPDLTGGTGYYGGVYIKIVGGDKSLHEIYLEDWCHDNIGRKVAMVMGGVPIPSWETLPAKIEDFKNCNPRSVGYYSYEAQQWEFFIDNQSCKLERTK